MDDDFNSCEAIGITHTFIHSILKLISEKGITDVIKQKVYSEFSEKIGILGIKVDNSENYNNNSEISDNLMNIILQIRAMARMDKNYKLSDFIRDELGKLNIEIRDTKDGVKYIKK